MKNSKKIIKIPNMLWSVKSLAQIKIALIKAMEEW